MSFSAPHQPGVPLATPVSHGSRQTSKSLRQLTERPSTLRPTLSPLRFTFAGQPKQPAITSTRLVDLVGCFLETYAANTGNSPARSPSIASRPLHLRLSGVQHSRNKSPSLADSCKPICHPPARPPHYNPTTTSAIFQTTLKKSPQQIEVPLSHLTLFSPKYPLNQPTRPIPNPCCAGHCKRAAIQRNH